MFLFLCVDGEGREKGEWCSGFFFKKGGSDGTADVECWIRAYDSEERLLPGPMRGQEINAR